MPRIGRLVSTTCGMLGHVMERITKSNVKRARPQLHLDPCDPNPIIAVEAPLCAEPMEAREPPKEEEELPLDQMRQWLE